MGINIFSQKEYTTGILEDMVTVTASAEVLPFTADAGSTILGIQVLTTDTVTVTTRLGNDRSLNLVANVIYPVQLNEITSATDDTVINVFLGALIV